MDAIQRNPQTEPRHESDEEAEDGTGGLIQLTEITKTFLEAAFLRYHDKHGLQKVNQKDRGTRLQPSLLPQARWVIEGGSAQGHHKGGWESVASSAV